MEFQFVDNREINGKHRKLIRSHVMKGKNVGKERRRPTPRRQVPARGDTHDEMQISAQANLPKSKHRDGDPNALSICRPLTDDLAFCHFTSDLKPSTRESIYHWVRLTRLSVHPLECCVPEDASRSVWFQYLQTNEAFFHCVLAMSEATRDEMLGREVTSQTLQHFSNTYRFINRDLESRRVPCDEIVAAVTALAIYEDLRLGHTTAKIHIDALRRMVDLRGGIDGFSTNSLLTLKICRADIEHAMHDCSETRFYRDRFPHETIRTALGQTPLPSGPGSGMIDAVKASDPQLLQTYLDFTMACDLLNAEPTRVKLTQFTFQDMLNSLCYRLLRLYPLAAGIPPITVDTTYSPGLLALLTTLLFQRGRVQRLSYLVLKERLRETIEERLDSPGTSDTTLLWLLFVGGISVFEPDDGAWLLPRIKTCLHRLDIDSWQLARKKIKKLPWIDLIHDDPGRKLWQSVIWT